MLFAIRHYNQDWFLKATWLDFYNGFTAKDCFSKECVCFKAVTFIVINLELLPYNSSTLLTLRNTIQAAAWTSVWMETPKTIHFMVLWRPRSLLSSAALWRPNYSQKNLHWQTFYFSRFHIVWKSLKMFCIDGWWESYGLKMVGEYIKIHVLRIK